MPSDPGSAHDRIPVALGSMFKTVFSARDLKSNKFTSSAFEPLIRALFD